MALVALLIMGAVVPLIALLVVALIPLFAGPRAGVVALVARPIVAALIPAVTALLIPGPGPLVPLPLFVAAVITAITGPCGWILATVLLLLEQVTSAIGARWGR